MSPPPPPSPTRETGPPPDGSEAPRIIKKYSNRRLYDTHISAYVTLEDINYLVLDSIAFKVIDVQTGKDLTCSILLQIISQQEAHRGSVFSAQTLSDIIRCYGESLQGATHEFLSHGMEMLFRQQREVQHQVQQITDDPMRTMSEIMEQNMSLWSDVQRDFLQAMGLPDDTTGRRKSPRRTTRNRPDPKQPRAKKNRKTPRTPRKPRRRT